MKTSFCDSWYYVNVKWQSVVLRKQFNPALYILNLSHLCQECNMIQDIIQWWQCDLNSHLFKEALARGASYQATKRFDA